MGHNSFADVASALATNPRLVLFPFFLQKALVDLAEDMAQLTLLSN